MPSTPLGRARLHVHEMDCAEEAALVRRALSALPGVRVADCDLVQGLVDVEIDRTRRTDDEVVRAVRSTGLSAHVVASDAAGQLQQSDAHLHEPRAHGSNVRSAVSAGLFLGAWGIEGLSAAHWLAAVVYSEHTSHSAVANLLYGIAALVAVWPMLPRAAAAVRHLRLDMHALVSFTVAGAAAIGEWSEAAAVALLFGVAHRLEAWSLERARRDIAALAARGPAMVAEGDEKVTPPVARPDSTARWIERFAARYTPLVVGAAVSVALLPPLLTGEWSTWFYRALLLLVLACPCALVISTPVTIVAALSAVARHGVLVRGGDVLERAATATAATAAGLTAVGVITAPAHALAAQVRAADVVVTGNDERAVMVLVTHARRARRVVQQNIAIALVTKAAFLVAAVFGAAPLWLAVLADTGATVLVTLNGLRLLHVRRDSLAASTTTV